MTLTELRYIVALAQTQHFGKAAKLCHVSQPTLSVAISKLEKSLKITLFERQSSGIRITELGQTIVQQAQRVLEEAEKIKALSSQSDNQLTQPLRIGAIYTIGPYLLPPLIPKLKKIAPQMPLIIQESYTHVLREKLKQGDLDAIFVALPFTEPGVVTKKLYEENFVTLLPKQHPLSQSERITPKQLSEHTVLLLGQGHCFRDQILDYCPQIANNKAIQQTIEDSSLETLRAMVASGYGLTILPATAAQHKAYPNQLQTKAFKGTPPKRQVALAWRSSFPRTQAIDALIKALSLSKIADICPIST